MRRSPAILSFSTLREAFEAGVDSPRELLERCLAAIAERDAKVQAFVVLNPEGARAAADAATARWRQRRPRSPVDGMPVAIKDIFETRDMPTGMGSAAFRGWQSNRDAACVWALREAGAVIVGKSATTEFAAKHPGSTSNPLDPERTPGGSSSGSAAAVAAGMVPLAIGSQVIGSVLRPASFCGVIGFKPSVGALNKGGGLDAYSQNCVGILAGDLNDAVLAADAIGERAGGDPGFPPFSAASVPSTRRPGRLAALQTRGWAQANPSARHALEAQIRRARDARIDIVDRSTSTTVDALEDAIYESMELSQELLAFEFRWPLGPIMERAGSRLSAYQHERNRAGEAVSRDRYALLLKRREDARRLYAGLQSQVDGCITLAAPGAAPLGLAATGDPVFNVPASWLGVPAVSLPLMECDGLPLGLQLIGFFGRDRELLDQAAWFHATKEEAS